MGDDGEPGLSDKLLHRGIVEGRLVAEKFRDSRLESMIDFVLVAESLAAVDQGNFLKRQGAWLAGGLLRLMNEAVLKGLDSNLGKLPDAIKPLDSSEQRLAEMLDERKRRRALLVKPRKPES